MSDSLIDKLHRLDAILAEVRQRYQQQHSELKTLKAKPQIDVTQLNQLKLQLAEVKNSQRSVTQERDNLQQKLTALQQGHQTLSKKYDQLTAEHQALTEEVDTLKRNNAILQEKNRTAAASTKLVLERLAQIDNTIE